MLNRLLTALLIAVVLVTGVSCSALDGTSRFSRLDRSRYRGYVSDSMMKRPQEHRAEWAVTEVIDWVGQAATGMAGGSGVSW